MFTWVFWKATLSAAITAFAYTLIGVLGTGPSGLDFFSIDWKHALGVSLVVALVAILHAIVPVAPQVAAARRLRTSPTVPMAPVEAVPHRGEHEAPDS